ncbi:hypothetical protein Agub_g3817, partial [Astrephomene gubernaculifera]
VDCIDTPLISGLMPPAPPGGAPAVPDTLYGSGPRIVLLGSSSTLYCSRLLTWQERLRTLADIGKWKLGLRFALDFYKLHLSRNATTTTTTAASSPAAASAAANPTTAGGGGGGGRTAAPPDSSPYGEALRGWLAFLAVGLVKSVLGGALRTAAGLGMSHLELDRLPGDTVRQLREAAAAAVLACLAAGRERLLSDSVFPLCREAGAAGPLVEAMEVAVLSG